MRRLLAFFGLDAGGFGGGRRSARESPAMIGIGMKVKGEIRGEGSLTVLGQFEGDIVLDGTLHVGPEGRVDANITARAIVVGGIVRGNLSADTRVEILPTGALTGSVKSSSFSAADGASVKSELWLERPEDDPDAPQPRG
jgi:cytoskeletal protein CcmA (bactofilin family)